MDHRYPNFDLLRMLLALEVVFVHAWSMTDPSFGWPGWIVAVPSFLAVSGVLVLQSYSDSRTWKSFIKKRALRLLPALIASLALCWLLFDWFAVYNSILNWLTGGIYTLPGVANGPLWSLAWEELAYLSLALLWMVGAYRHPIIIWLLLAATTAVAINSRQLAPHTQIILYLAPAFLIGNLAYLYRHWLLKAPSFVPWVALLAVINSSSIPWFGPLVEKAPILFQAFTVAWVGMAGFKLVPFRFPDISYGLYIYHMPIILYLVRNEWATTPSQMALLLPAPLLIFCVGSWYLVEKPALRFKPPPANQKDGVHTPT